MFDQICKILCDTINTITFELRDNNGVVLDDTTYTVLEGEQRLVLNFEVPIGNDMELGIATNNSGLYRNSSGANFPYNIGDLINVTSSSAGSNYYYFYYDIEVEVSCENVLSTITNNSINQKRKLIKIQDILGKKTKPQINTPLIEIYDDGTVKKKIVVE